MEGRKETAPSPSGHPNQILEDTRPIPRRADPPQAGAVYPRFPVARGPPFSHKPSACSRSPQRALCSLLRKYAKKLSIDFAAPEKGSVWDLSDRVR
ncbi:hypothetical protein L345_18418, partial [Ophiophagus hannah]